MAQDENPPAFPRDERHLGHNGMTLRDWFAGQAITAAFDHVRMNTDDCTAMGFLPEEWTARIAYGVADAMLSYRAVSL